MCALAALCALLFVQCSNNDDGEQTSTTSSSPSEKTFDTWDDFRASPDATQTQGQQVVFIGIDGASWWYVNQLIDQGKLPNIARIKREGSYGPLRSVPSQVSPPAWCSMMTGYLPGKTGIYSFGKWVRQTEQFLTVRSDDVKVPFVWDAVSRSGRKVAVINVPMSYPVGSVNGVMVSGLLTPIDLESPIGTTEAPSQRKSEYPVDRTLGSFSPVAGTAAEDSLNLFLCLLYDTKDDGIREYDTISLRVLSKFESDPAKKELDRCSFPTNEYSRWVNILYEREGKAAPAYCKLMCKTGKDETVIKFSSTLFPIEAQFTYPPELADELNNRFGYYLPTKFLAADILSKVTQETADHARYFYDYDDWDLFNFVFTQTDNVHHLVGFTDLAAEVYETIDELIGDVMARMPEGSTLMVGSDHGFNQYPYGVDMNHFLARLKLLAWKDKNTIDHANTLVFHNLFFLYFNRDLISRDELATRGLNVPPGGDPVDYLVQYITDAGSTLRAPERAFPLEFIRQSGGVVGEAPEMMVKGTYTDFLVEDWNIMKPHGNVLWNLEGSDRFWHERDGVFMMWGKNVRVANDAGAKDIQDIAPTMLYLLGLPLAPDMDGKPMLDVFTPEFVSKHPRYTVTDYRNIPKEMAEDTEERESLQKKLRSLGYIQ